MKISEVPNSMYLYQNFNEDIKDPQNNNINNINNINDLNDYDFESYQNNQKIFLNSNQMDEHINKVMKISMTKFNHIKNN